MSRIEFKKAVKEAAWARSGGACEADGSVYKLPPGVRCGEDMTIKGVEYDHVNPVEQSQDAELTNCLAICPTCHKAKYPRDAAILAKGKHQQQTVTKATAPRRHRPMAGTKASGFRKRMDGTVERRT